MDLFVSKEDPAEIVARFSETVFSSAPDRGSPDVVGPNERTALRPLHERRDREEPPQEKKPRYDRLGREIKQEDSTLNANGKDMPPQKLQRPRGRPPKGKIWNDYRGWVVDGLGRSKS